MAQLKITRASGDVATYKITPVIEYAFEQQFKAGIHKQFRDAEKQSDIYWLSWECIRRSGETVKPFGDAFLESLESVEVVDDDPKG